MSHVANDDNNIPSEMRHRSLSQGINLLACFRLLRGLSVTFGFLQRQSAECCFVARTPVSDYLQIEGGATTETGEKKV